MADLPSPVKPSFAALKNVMGFRELVAKVQQRSPSLPNIGVCHGRSGDGKSYASINAQNRTRAIRVERIHTRMAITLPPAIALRASSSAPCAE